MPDPRTEIGELWHSVNREVHDRFRSQFRDFAIPPLAIPLFRIISQEQGITISELARRSYVAKSHVSKVIDQMVGEGLLEKRADASDQRLVRIYRTEAGTRVVADMEAQARAVWRQMIQHVPEEDLAVILRGLRVLVHALRESDSKQ